MKYYYRYYVVESYGNHFSIQNGPFKTLENALLFLYEHKDKNGRWHINKYRI